MVSTISRLLGAGRLTFVMGMSALPVLLSPATPQAEELPTFTLEMNNGTFTPNRLVVPAGPAVKIVIKNTGNTPAEFESTDLRREKVLAPGTTSFVVIRRLSPGEYSFFDEFHMDAGEGTIVAE